MCGCGLSDYCTNCFLLDLFSFNTHGQWQRIAETSKQKPRVRPSPPPTLAATALPLPQTPTILDNVRKLIDLHRHRGTLGPSEEIPTNSQREFALYAYITHYVSLFMVTTKQLDRIPRFWSSLMPTKIKKHFFESHPPSLRKARTSNSTYTATL